MERPYARCMQDVCKRCGKNPHSAQAMQQNVYLVWLHRCAVPRHVEHSKQPDELCFSGWLIVFIKTKALSITSEIAAMELELVQLGLGICYLLFAPSWWICYHKGVDKIQYLFWIKSFSSSQSILHVKFMLSIAIKENTYPLLSGSLIVVLAESITSTW